MQLPKGCVETNKDIGKILLCIIVSNHLHMIWYYIAIFFKSIFTYYIILEEEDTFSYTINK